MAEKMTTLSHKELAAARDAAVREASEANQRRFFDEIVQSCGVCWDEAEHERGFCQTDEGREYKEMYDRQRAQLDDPQPAYLMSDKQLSFIRSLVAERDVVKDGYTFEDWARSVKLEKFSKSEASDLIDSLLKRPKAETKRQDAKVSGLDLRSLPSGYYAVPGGDTRLKLKIDVVDNGKWDGWVFVKDAAVYGEGKRYGRQRPGEAYSGDVQDALTAILQDPIAAQAEYGKLTNKCGRCNRPLEDETSVELGIGPVCRELLGM